MLWDVVAVDGCLIDLEGGFLYLGKRARLDEDEVVNQIVGVAIENTETDRLARFHFDTRRVELQSLDRTDRDGPTAFFGLS